MIFNLMICFAPSEQLISQSINGKLGTSGQFIIRDTANTFLTLNQSTGDLSLNRNLALLVSTPGSQLGSIFKGTARFIHNYSPATSFGNTFLGINSGNFTMNGTGSQSSNNTGVGENSLAGLTIGYQNSAFGVSSLFNNTIGYRNSAFGNTSLQNNTTGSNNSAFGHLSLNANIIGTYNSAFGNQSLQYNTDGNYNSAFGNFSLNANTTGFQNSAFGHLSLALNSTGNYNSAFGVRSLDNSTTGIQNSAFGYFSGSGITTGSNNTTIGYNAQVPSASSSDQVRVGNTSVTYAGIQVAWTITSDRRWKSDIQSSNLGLNFISKLRPVSYFRNNDDKQKTEYGFIAQEVEDVLKGSGVENSGMLIISDEGMYELRYNDLLAPMVKSIQELKAENDELKNKNVSLEERLAKYEQMQNTLVKKMEELESKNKDLKEVKFGEK